MHWMLYLRWTKKYANKSHINFATTESPDAFRVDESPWTTPLPPKSLEDFMQKEPTIQEEQSMIREPDTVYQFTDQLLQREIATSSIKTPPPFHAEQLRMNDDRDENMSQTPAYQLAHETMRTAAMQTMEFNPKVDEPEMVAPLRNERQSLPPLKQEVRAMETRKPLQAEDEVASRLLQAVSNVLEDRSLLHQDLQEFKKGLELTQRKAKEIEDENKLLELRIAEKDSELERRELRMVDLRYKLDQLQENYQHLSAAKDNEYQRMQDIVTEMQTKYDALSRDYGALRRESSSQIERLESMLRHVELRNGQLAAEAEQVRKENASLTRQITEFAQKISGVLGQVVPTDMPRIMPVPNRNSSDDRAQA
jgi:DNA repair exonuclease SbcCD ATPase subunit